MSNFNLRRDVLLTWEILDSEAFKALSTSAIRVLLRFLQKRTWEKRKVKGLKKIVYSNDALAFTYAEAAFLGIKNTAFYESIRRLVEVGFIDVDPQGGCYGIDYSRYSLSERWSDYGTDNF